MEPHYLQRYDRMCDHAAAQVIAQYSTSFSLATRLLDHATKRDIRNLYAMVRIADEIVDGTARAADTDPAETLDAYERQVLAAPTQRFHTDPVVHAYANSARRCGFDPEHVRAFFASMRSDITAETDLAEYIYGSAEVIGLLCLSIFLHDAPPNPNRTLLEGGARALGSAFQKINFLRDYGEDSRTLGRTYVAMDEEAKAALIAEIRAELAQAEETIPLLPRKVRAGVAAAAALFSELTDIAEATPAAELATTRISVPNHRKLALTTRAALRNR